MANYKVIIDGEEDEEVFDSYNEANEYGSYLVSCWHTGAETLEMSNFGDYPYDPEDAPEYEVVQEG